MVSIQEIEEKTEGSEFSAVSPIPGNNNTETINQEAIQEDQKQNTEDAGGKIPIPVQLERNQRGHFERTSQRSVQLQYQRPLGFDSSQSRPRPRPYYPLGSSSYTSARALSSASAAAPPVMTGMVDPVSSIGFRSHNLANNRMPGPSGMRTGIPSCSFRPRPERIEFGGVHPRTMAPAVQIRTVVPVCSAPPATRKYPSSNQEGQPPMREKENAG